MNALKRVFTPWFWPRNVKTEATFLTRLGRLVHWTLAGAAALVFVIGIFSWWQSIGEHKKSLDDIAAWNKQHPEAGKGAGSPWQQYQAAGNSFDAFDTPPANDKPYESPLDTFSLWVGILGGLGLSFAGRGVRYVLTSE
jgi:hypothetical protein